MFPNWECDNLGDKKLRIIARSTLVKFWISHPTSKEPLQAWYKETESANWQSTEDIKQRYASASFLADNRVCFNISGNTFKLIVKVNYKFHIVYIRFIETHAEYNKIDAETI